MKHRVPLHLGVIPDGNRRWAVSRGLAKHEGYARGVPPAVRLAGACRAAGILEISVYGFTKENVRRPAVQVRAFRAACIELARLLVAAGARLRLVGDRRSQVFPREAEPLEGRGGRGALKVNLLVNYGWRWDLEGWARGGGRSRAVPPLDLVVRWGGGRRLSGFLPMQAAYADFHVEDALWPDYEEAQLGRALAWYRKQDRTLGG